ncbi:MAG: hypothetical protein ABIQ30_04055 [Devosia sp.]
MLATVYGDESCGLRAISYAVVVVPVFLGAVVEHGLAEIKVRYGGAPDEELHSTELLRKPERRAQLPFAHLTHEEIMQMLADVAALAQRWALQSSIALSPLPDTASPAEGAASRPMWTHIDGSEVPFAEADMRILEEHDKKSVARLAGISLLPVMETYPIPELRFVLDPDEDGMVRWSPSDVKLMELIEREWFPFSPGRITLANVPRPKPPLLQVADVLAFASTRSELPDSITTRRFRAIVATFAPVTSRCVVD